MLPGKAVYDQHCAACHGINGDGNGPAAVWLYPKPRHFNSGLFKIKSTPPGFMPSDEDLLRTVEATPGAVGILDVYAINSAVKVLRIDGKLPFDTGYALKGN